jgi:hypothetical protein
MKRIALFLAASLLPLLACADSIEGDITLDYTESGFTAGGFKEEFGTALKATSNWYVGEFAGQETLFAGVTVTNATDRPMYFEYYVAFLDKDKKLVGATGEPVSGEEGLKPGKAMRTVRCQIHLPKDKYKEIAFYQAVLYESDKPPRVRKQGGLP